MKVLSRAQITELTDLKEKDKAASIALWEYVAKIFQPGVEVYWKSGGGRYLQHGMVRGFIGGPGSIRLRVNNLKTLKTVDISLYDIDYARMINRAAE